MDSDSYPDFLAVVDQSGDIEDEKLRQIITSGGTPASGTSPFAIGSRLALSAAGLSGVRTFTFPDASDQVTTNTAAETLTNKTIDFNQNTILNLPGSSGGSPFTIGSNLILSAVGLTAPRTFAFPDQSDTVAGISAAQALTNKTINFSNNTILNIPPAVSGNSPFTIGSNLILSQTGLTAPRTFTFPDANGTVITTTSPASSGTSPFTIGSDIILSQTGLSAARTFTFPDVSDKITTNTAIETLTNKTIDYNSNTILNLPSSGGGITTLQALGIATYKYVVFLNSGDNLYKCFDTTQLSVVSSNSDPTVVIQFAINNVNGGAIYIKPGTYQLSTQLNCINKSFRMIGEHANTQETAGMTILQANYNGSTPINGSTALINTHNSSEFSRSFEKIVIDCNNLVPIGIDAYWVRRIQPFCRDVMIINGTDTGMLLSGSWYSNCYNLVIESCTNYGLHVPVDNVLTISSFNTFYFFGGRISSNGTNVFLEEGNDWGFESVIMEGLAPTTTHVKVAAGINMGRWRNCSFENASATNNIVNILDDGNNNTYENCRFDKDASITLTAIHLTSNARNTKILFNNFQGTCTIQIDSGVQGAVLMGNTAATNTPPTITFTDNGTKTRCYANQDINIADKNTGAV